MVCSSKVVQGGCMLLWFCGCSFDSCCCCVWCVHTPCSCDGEGRIIGGLAAIPGFGWWPIKAYRPCSGLSAAGMDYVR